MPEWLLTSAEREKLLLALQNLRAAAATKAFDPFQGAAPRRLKDLLDKRQGEGRPSLQTILRKPERLIEEPEDKLREARRAFQTAVQLIEARVDGLPDRALMLLDAPVSRVLGTARDDGSTGFLAAYTAVRSARETAEEFVRRRLPWIAPKVLDALRPGEGDTDLLQEEIDALTAVTAEGKPVSNAANRKSLQTLLRRWQAGDAAPLLILDGVEQLAGEIARGDVFAVIDVAALRDELEDQLSQLVPTRARLAYNFGAPFDSSKVKDNPLFAPQPGSRFDLAFRADIDILRPNDVSYEADGSIGPFHVNLLHQFGIEAIRLIFGGATFRMASGEKFQFDVDFQDFEIGPALAFVESLQDYLSQSAGGAYVEPLWRTPGVRAGYGLDLGIIPLGALTFSNVSLAISAELPFTDETALFNVSLSRRMAPFMISALPWAGSGFFGIIANANAIIGFEAALEFGVGGAFQIGPLVGQGRVQAGFHIRTITIAERRVTEISGTFFAGGSASIWIFSFAASLYVRLGMREGGDMFGEAVFSFSFKLGFARFGYSVRTAYGQDKLAGGENGRQARDARLSPIPSNVRLVRYASLEGGPISDAAPDGGACRSTTSQPQSQEARAETSCMGRDWAAYSAYFDASLLGKATR